MKPNLESSPSESLLAAIKTAPVAFIAWYHQYGIAGAWWLLVRSGWLVARAIATGRKTAALVEERLSVCAECPYRDGIHCGTPGRFVPGTDVQMGCWCVLPLAARLPTKTCWARDQDLNEGWLR